MMIFDLFFLVSQQVLELPFDKWSPFMQNSRYLVSSSGILTFFGSH